MKRLTRIKPYGNYTKGTYQDLVDDFSAIPNCIVEPLGLSQDGGFQLYGIKYGDTDNKPIIFINSNIHGSEWASAQYAVEFIKRIATDDLPNKELVAELKARYSFYVIPSMNPYGYEHTQYTNVNLVNLNRNWDNRWEVYEGNAQGEGNNYKGTAPFSEAEAKISSDKILELKPIMVLDCHTSANYGGIDVGKVFKWYRRLLDDADKTIHLTTGFEFPTIEWSVGMNPQTVGWAGNQTTDRGMKPLATLVEGVSPDGSPYSYDGMVEYGLNAIFALCVYAMNFYENRNLLLN